MRNRNRIPAFMGELGDMWSKNFPDLRFGQLMTNFFEYIGDPFYLEEDEFMRLFYKYVEEYGHTAKM